MKSTTIPRRVALIGSIVTALSLTACGPKVQSSLKTGQSLPRSIAVLPADYSVDVARERIDLLRSEIISELRNNNFVVADDKLVLSTCTSPACPEKKALADKYSVDGFATLKVDSFSKNNFLAGYYNALSGALTFTDKSGAELVNVTHTQSERGGVLFESGQVFQGIISQVKHTGDSVFEALATKFAKRLVDELPQNTPTTGQQPEATEVALNSVDAVWGSPTTYRVCAKGTPSSFGFVLWGKDRTTLREIRPGEYCGAFSTLSVAAATAPVQVELRSAFGNTVRREVSLPITPPCSLTDRLQVAEESNRRSLNVLCAVIGKASTSSGCSDKLGECRADKLVLYRGATPQGPFTKISEIRSASAPLPSANGAALQVVAIGTGGFSSLPASVEPKAQ